MEAGSSGRPVPSRPRPVPGEPEVPNASGAWGPPLAKSGASGSPGCSKAARWQACSSRRASVFQTPDPAPPHRTCRARAVRSPPGARRSAVSSAVARAARRAPRTGAVASRARASRTPAGNPATARPKGVTPSAPARPRRSKASRAAASAAAGGSSTQASPAPSGTPHTASSRAAPVRSAERISGVGASGERAQSVGEQQR